MTTDTENIRRHCRWDQDFPPPRPRIRKSINITIRGRSYRRVWFLNPPFDELPFVSLLFHHRYHRDSAAGVWKCEEGHND